MADRKMIGLPPDVYERFAKCGEEGDNDLVIMRRILDTLSDTEELRGSVDDLVSTNEHLQTQLDDLRGEIEADRQLADKQVDDYIQRIEERAHQIEDLKLGGGTAVVPGGGQVGLDSFGIKDVVEEARDMCGDDETGNKLIGKMIDMKAHFASKAVDHEHAAEQNQLDRDQKELDRKSKEELAENDRKERVKDRESKEKLATQEQENKLELQLMKKGIVRKTFLEDAAFANISSIPKRPAGALKNAKKQAYHEAEDEEEFGDDWDSAGENDE